MALTVSLLFSVFHSPLLDLRDYADWRNFGLCVQREGGVDNETGNVLVLEALRHTLSSDQLMGHDTKSLKVLRC